MSPIPPSLDLHEGGPCLPATFLTYSVSSMKAQIWSIHCWSLSIYTGVGHTGCISALSKYALSNVAKLQEFTLLSPSGIEGLKAMLKII